MESNQSQEIELENVEIKLEPKQSRPAEKFMVVGSGEATCKSCGYYYKPEIGDTSSSIPIGTRFSDIPEEWRCPTCGANKANFVADTKVYAGFAENQEFGLGTNSMTGEQKTLLIYGSLFFTFVLLIG